jgi:hypothetical protein
MVKVSTLLARECSSGGLSFMFVSFDYVIMQRYHFVSA